MENGPRAAGWASILKEHPAFGFFWCARVVGTLAYQMQAVAVGWQVYALTHSALQLGLVGLAEFLPMVCLTLVTGHVADRHDRRRIWMAALTVQGAGILFLAAGSWGGWLGVPGIYAAIVVIGVGRAFERPAGQALLPALVPESLFSKAIAWSIGAFQISSVLGPALGGILYAFGAGIPYTVAGVLALAGAGFLGCIRHEHRLQPRPPASLNSMFSGIHFIRAKSVILGSISLDLFAVLLGGATALLPAFAHDILGVGSQGLGVLRAAPAVGALIVSVALAHRPLGRKVGLKMFGAVAVFGLATIVFGLSRSFVLSCAALFVAGAADTVSVVIRGSLVQLETPDEMRGRVSAVNSLFIGTSNQLGEFESGVTAALLGTVSATVLGGIGTLVVAALWMRFFPSLRKFDRLGRADTDEETS